MGEKPFFFFSFSGSKSGSFVWLLNMFAISCIWLYLREMARLKIDESKSGRSSSLPTRDVPVGQTFIHCGREYRVIRRGVIDRVRDACVGCAFAVGTCPPSVACSAFDRADERNVWFEEI